MTFDTVATYRCDVVYYGNCFRVRSSTTQISNLTSREPSVRQCWYRSKRLKTCGTIESLDHGEYQKPYCGAETENDYSIMMFTNHGSRTRKRRGKYIDGHRIIVIFRPSAQITGHWFHVSSCSCLQNVRRGLVTTAEPFRLDEHLGLRSLYIECTRALAYFASVNGLTARVARC